MQWHCRNGLVKHQAILLRNLLSTCCVGEYKLNIRVKIYNIDMQRLAEICRIEYAWNGLLPDVL